MNTVPDIRIEALGAQTYAAAQPELAHVLRECVHGGASLGFLAPMELREALDFWHSLTPSVEAGSRLVLAARDPSTEAIVGTGQLVFEWKPNGRHRAEISKVLVLPTYRRRGIAARIMGELERHARGRGLRMLFLDTSEGAGGAQAFYESLGYQYAGGIPDWAMDPDGTLRKNAIYYRML